MAYSNAWTTVAPSGASAANTADDEIRKLRLDLEERLEEVAIVDMSADPVVHKAVSVDLIDLVTATPDLAVVYTGAAFAIPNNTVTTIDFVGETLDTASFHSNSVNPSRLTVATGGYFRIHANLEIAFAGAAGLCHIRIRKNGSDKALGNIAFLGSGVIETITISYIDLASDTDYYEITIQNTGTGTGWDTLDEADEAYFMIERLIGVTSV